ncbi:tRNA-dihydrouridine synthase family protein [Verrucomicrobiales bacterium BCK34]|nr:tRNA-dihydrouridine synthase family protein [Verrucomicrobiales bacterium BCK34]
MSPVPTLSLAPMQDVSVLPLWRCLERRGGADLYVTEYFRVHRDSHPDKEILRSITDFPGDKPVIAQMIGNDPEHLLRTTKRLQDQSDCSGIDINLGCPAPTVCGKLSGGALLKDHDLIREIAETLRPFVRGTFTLKTRVGFETADEFETLLALFASLPIDGLAIHGRTVREKYQSPVHTDCIAHAVETLPFPVTANGSIVSLDTALAMHRSTGASGLMIGRGGIRNPWIFQQIRDSFSGNDSPAITLREVRDYIFELRDEIRETGQFDSDTHLVHRMKKFTNYIASGIHGGEFNYALRRANTLTLFEEICDEHLCSDEAFPDYPDDDGKLFCGFKELVT